MNDLEISDCPSSITLLLRLPSSGNGCRSCLGALDYPFTTFSFDIVLSINMLMLPISMCHKSISYTSTQNIVYTSMRDKHTPSLFPHNIYFPFSWIKHPFPLNLTWISCVWVCQCLWDKSLSGHCLSTLPSNGRIQQKCMKNRLWKKTCLGDLKLSV